MSMQLGEAQLGTGSSGAEVKQVQLILQGQGYNVGPVDGIYGPQTQTAVQAFQRAKGLLPDGIVGPLTWSALQGQPASPAPLPPPRPEPAPLAFLSGLSMPLVVGAVGLLALLFLRPRR